MNCAARFALPFIGTVPAIKPACAASVSHLVSVLGTEATVQREYTKALIRDFGEGCAVTLVGSPLLAVLAEAYLRGEPINDAAIAREIAPCFVERGGRAHRHDRTGLHALSAVAGAAAHCAPWPVNFIDPAPAIARRVFELLPPAARDGRSGAALMVFTSGRRPSPALSKALTGFGLSA